MSVSLAPSDDTISTLTAHTWSPQPETARLVHRLLDECLTHCPFAASFSKRLLAETGTRLLDWIDHFAMNVDATLRAEFERVGYIASPLASGAVAWIHPGGIFPRVRQIEGSSRHLALKVESVVDFLCAHQLNDLKPDGLPGDSLRKALVARGDAVEFWIVERHGSLEFETRDAAKSPPGIDLQALVHHEEALRLRRRHFDSDDQGFAEANRLIDSAIADLGRDRTCDLFFAVERRYWQRRNRAGRIQLARQQELGMGWANHDHHTYRSSRASFVSLIAFLEKLGFQCRERFYAGLEAGWGAQVIEHPVTGVTIFADVDLSPEELAQDFSHEPVPERRELGTVGLWCALHGEAFLQAGMHHLECQFDFAATRDQLRQVGIETMPPFTDFPYLRQAFTRGEQWPVDPSRVDRLRTANKITDPQARQFLEHGALGSHLEILQRDDGYKGFNQSGINEIISATDPRRASNH